MSYYDSYDHKWYEFYQLTKKHSVDGGYFGKNNVDAPISKIDLLEKEVLQLKDPAMAYYFVNRFGDLANRSNEICQQIIIDKKSVQYAYLYAKNIEKHNFEDLQKIVIESKQPFYMARFGCFVKGADPIFFEKFVLEHKCPQPIDVYMFLKSNKFAKDEDGKILADNLDKYKSILIKSKKPRYLFELAKNIPESDSDLPKIEDLVVKSKSVLYARMYAEYFSHADVDKFEQAVVERGDEEEMRKFASYVKKSRMRKMSFAL